MSQIQTSIEASVAASASKVTLAGSTVGVIGGLADSSIGMWAGIVIGVTGLLVNLFFKYRSDIRSQKAYEAYIKKLENQSVLSHISEPGEDD